MSTFEKKWWFEAPCSLAAAFLASLLLTRAGLDGAEPNLVFKALAWGLCFAGLHRGIASIAVRLVRLAAGTSVPEASPMSTLGG